MYLVFRGGDAGEKEDGNHAQLHVGLQGAADLEAGHVGHVNVEQDDVRLLAMGGLQAGYAAAGTNNIEMLFRQAGLGHGQGVRAVVDHEDFHRESLPAEIIVV